MKHEAVKKQFCLNKLSPNDALQFAVVKERGEIMYKRVSGGVSKFGRNKFYQWRQNNNGKY